MADQNTPSTAIPIKVTLVDQSGAFVAGSAVTIADNGNAVEGALADAAITTNTTGSISGKLRGVVALLAGGIAVSWASAQHVIVDTAPSTAVTNANLDVALSTRTKPADQQHAIIDSGTVTTVSTVTSLTQMNGAAIAMNTGLRAAGVQRVTIATDDLVPVSGTVTATVASTTLTATVAPTGLGTAVSGRQAVTTAGTAVQFTSQACKVVAITAETDNTGYIVIGDSAVVAALATRKGTPLAPGDTAVLAVSNMNLLYIDSTVSTDGVTWMVLS